MCLSTLLQLAVVVGDYVKQCCNLLGCLKKRAPDHA